uniref:Uncharacterized protein n=1 Tax=Amphimedon queenslandica TaxID=400682 RepID=A0A1X7SED9_AMPQE
MVDTSGERQLANPLRTWKKSTPVAVPSLFGSRGQGRPEALAHEAPGGARPGCGCGSPRTNLASPPPSGRMRVVASSVDEDLRGVQS